LAGPRCHLETSENRQNHDQIVVRIPAKIVRIPAKNSPDFGIFPYLPDIRGLDVVQELVHGSVDVREPLRGVVLLPLELASDVLQDVRQLLLNKRLVVVQHLVQGHEGEGRDGADEEVEAVDKNRHFLQFFNIYANAAGCKE
jgi:hypothetical protein